MTLPGYTEPRAPPFCPGKDDVCFAFAGPLTLRTNSYKTIFDPKVAKTMGSRIWLSQCVTVPKQCGGIGQPCCPGASIGVVTDKALPSFGKSWQGHPCDDTQTPEGAYCNGARRLAGACGSCGSRVCW